MFDAPLKTVVMMRLKSLMTGEPSEKRSCSGTTVHPRRTPVNPAYLEKEHVSIAQSSAPGQVENHQSSFWKSCCLPMQEQSMVHAKE